MTPTYESIQNQIDSSFLVRRFGDEAFSAPYHFHPEYELTLILKGEGTRYIGNKMAPFFEDDLILLGPNIPHCWKLETEGKSKGSCIVIQFAHHFLGDGFFSGIELSKIQSLLTKSIHGLSFERTIRLQAISKIITLTTETDKFKKLIIFLEILQFLAIGEHYIQLEYKVINYKQSQAGLERINLVLAYIVENFRHQISLTEAAKIVYMTPTAFCKYFKRVTRKTFFDTVLEYRLNYVTQQLTQSDKSIAMICYDSGFNDISYFNKAFKSRLHLTPLIYRKAFSRIT